MDSKTDAEVRSKQDRRPRPETIVERFDMSTGVWHRVVVREDEEYQEMSAGFKNSYLDIVTSITEIIATGKLNKPMN